MTWRISKKSSTSPRAGGIAAFSSRVGRGGRAFTLVELITVMAIMAILMAMIVGVVPRIQDAWRARLTRTRLLAVVAALQAYAEDYSGKYPWILNDANMVSVSDPLILGINLNDVPSGYKEAVVLYGALTSVRRRGPYYKAAGGQTVVRQASGKVFNLFADGWERPILYEHPTETSLLVRSLGKDGATGGDDIGYFVFQN
jgi:prepilin-type N-terminal cleavage/methylation domain-containing protein